MYVVHFDLMGGDWNGVEIGSKLLCKLVELRLVEPMDAPIIKIQLSDHLEPGIALQPKPSDISKLAGTELILSFRHNAFHGMSIATLELVIGGDYSAISQVPLAFISHYAAMRPYFDDAKISIGRSGDYVLMFLNLPTDRFIKDVNAAYANAAQIERDQLGGVLH